MSSALTDAMAATREDERRRAARALLRQPLLRADGRGAELFTLVVRHAEALREWFDRETGWRLLVNSEIARLAKSGATTEDHTHPATDPGRRLPFGRRRYVLACLALAVLERVDSQVTLGRLAEQVVVAAGDPVLVAAGVTFTLERRDERSDLVAVVRLLMQYGLLVKVAGEEQAFVDGLGDALYDVRRRVLASLLTTVRGPSTVHAVSFSERLSAITSELPATTDELRNRQLRHRLTRRLLDDPVLYLTDLDEQEQAYLTHQRNAITARIAAFTGLVAEIRAEGIAMVDPSDDLTDVRMPEVGTDGHVTLLLADHLTVRVGEAVPERDLHRWIRRQAQQYVPKRVWRRSAGEDGAEVELTATALGKLEALRLVHRGDDGVVALPAIARYAVTEPTVSTGARRG